MTSRKLLTFILLAPTCFFTACAGANEATAKQPAPSAVITGAVMQPVVRQSAPPPKPVFNVRDYGAKGDGVTDDTEALRKAIAACAGSGGSVFLDKGIFRAGSLEFKSGMTLYVAKGATLRATDKPADFPVRKASDDPAKPFESWRAFLHAHRVSKFEITGGGTLDGNGRGLRKAGMLGPEGNRPSLLIITDGKDIAVHDITLVDSHMWTQIYGHCENLTIKCETLRGLSTGYSANSDGMDICNCRHVVIRDNDIESDDDSICLKSEGATTGIEDVLITNNTILNHGANGIKFGSATAGPIRNVRILNNLVTRANLGGLCIESVDGADVSDITVKGLTLQDCMHPIFIRLGARLAWASKGVDKPGSITGVTIENVVVTPTQRGNTDAKVGNGWREPSCTVTGMTQKNLGEILFKDIHIVMPGGITTPIHEPRDKELDKVYPQSSIFGRVPASVFFVRHADNVRFENIEVGTAKPETRPWLCAVDAKVETQNIKELGVIAPDVKIQSGK